MQSEDINDLLAINDTCRHRFFDEDLDVGHLIDSQFELSFPQPPSTHPLKRGIDLKAKFPEMAEEMRSSQIDSYDGMSSDDDCSGTLSKRQGLDKSGPRKKRLRGAELIQSLKRNPMFRDHEELFEENMDDLTRKKLMQKIRNRVSAQESRDRKKVQMCGLLEKNIILEKENCQLKNEVEELKKENRALKKKVDELSSTKANSVTNRKTDCESNSEEKSSFTSEVNLSLNQDEDISLLGRSLKRQVSGDSRLGWQTFMMLAVAIALCCITLPGAPAGGDDIKSSAIVPMIGGFPKANSKALVRLEQVCKEFCDSYDHPAYRSSRNAKEIGKHLLDLDPKIVLSTSSALNLTLENGSLNNPKVQMVQSYQGADYLSNSGPYSTMVCSSVVDLDKSSNLIRTDDFVHFIYPKEKQAIVGEGIMDDEDSSLHSEYVGILAKVISKKDIRVYQNENVMKTL